LSKWRTVAVIALAVAGVISIYLDFIWSPPEAKMGDVVRIMYFHIACALVAFLAFGVTALAGAATLLLRVRRMEGLMKPARTGPFRLFVDPWAWDRLAYGSAQIALIFTTLVLASGSIWGAAVWNTWWTWDPTLTTTLILWFLNIGYLLLRGSIADRGRAVTISSVYGIIAALDVPLIHQSVTWWSGLHPKVITDAGFNMPPSMVLTLLVSFVIFLGVYWLFTWMAVSETAQRSAIGELREQVRERLWQAEESHRLSRTGSVKS